MLTAQLARWVSTPLTGVSDAVRNAVCTAFVDTVGVMLAGADEPVTKVVRRFVASGASTSTEASVLMGESRALSRDAVLINATAAHALDYDDVGLMGHPSAVLVPALLAEGERLHVTGAALIEAYVTGYEVWAELIARDEHRHHEKGWHPTAVFGVVAAAAAVAGLRRLPSNVVGHALGIAASCASGLIANFGSMTKPFHAGHAASSGIDAVNLAEAGMTAASDAIEHQAGFLAALSPRGRVDRQPCAESIGKRLRLAELGLTVKKYPMCFATHRVIDGVLDLIGKYDIYPDQVRRVHATVGKTQAAMLRNHRPTTALQAKFSLEFAVACAFVGRKVGLAELTDNFVQLGDVQRLMSLVEISTVDSVCQEEPTLAASDRVVVELTDARVLDTGEIFSTRGGIGQPLRADELATKFFDCTALSGDCSDLYGKLVRLHELTDVAVLTLRHDAPQMMNDRALTSA